MVPVFVVVCFRVGVAVTDDVDVALAVGAALAEPEGAGSVEGTSAAVLVPVAADEAAVGGATTVLGGAEGPGSVGDAVPPRPMRNAVTPAPIPRSAMTPTTMATTGVRPPEDDIPVLDIDVFVFAANAAAAF